jgi:hypothetical protein
MKSHDCFHAPSNPPQGSGPCETRRLGVLDGSGSPGHTPVLARERSREALVRGRDPFAASWLVTALLVALALPCAEREPSPRPCPFPRWLGPGGGASPLVACEGAGEGRALEGALPLLFGGRIDLARADVAALDVLPGVGPALAAAIVAERERGPFCDVGELDRVPGIGPSTLARLAPWLEPGTDPRCAPLSGRAGGP